MSNNQYPINSNKYDIHERIFNFIVEVINSLEKLPKTPKNLIFLNQITRSVTSMGANDQEADGAITARDFIHGFTLVRKEGKETIFWLRIIEKVNNDLDIQFESLIQEGKEIISIISTIIRKTSRSSKSI